jgi:hypothetical protein
MNKPRWKKERTDVREHCWMAEKVQLFSLSCTKPGRKWKHSITWRWIQVAALLQAYDHRTYSNEMPLALICDILIKAKMPLEDSGLHIGQEHKKEVCDGS